MDDWAELGANPAPGSVVALQELARTWTVQAQQQRAAAAGLDACRTALPDAWRDSRGADAFGAALAGPIRSLAGTAPALDGAAAAVHGYADRLADAQARARLQLAVARTARDALVRAQGVVDQKVREVMSPLGPFDPRVLMLPGELQAAQAAHQSAAVALNRVMADARQLADEVRVAAVQAAAELDTQRDLLEGWADGRRFGPHGTPAEGSLAASSAYRGYLDALANLVPPAIPADPYLAARYWRNLDPELRADYRRLYPSQVGTANGLPAADRDPANRLSLAALLTDARTRAAALGRPLPGPAVDPDEPAARAAIAASLAAIGDSPAQARAVAGALAVDYQLRRAATTAPGIPRPTVQLLLFDPAAYDGKGRAAIGIGDVATAANVAVLVPGMTSDVPGYLDNQTGNAAALYSSAWDSSAWAGGSAAQTAVVAYVGYLAPGPDPRVATQDLARTGAAVVATDLSGFAAMRTSTPARTTVIAHSYGSTTAAIAFAERGARADALVLIGSPGAGSARQAAQLGVPVFVGSASGDPITTLAQQAQDPAQVAAAGALAGMHYGGPHGLGAAGGLLGAAGGPFLLAGLRANLGVDPAGARFGAIRFHAETPSKDSYLGANHSQYYRPGSESLANITRIVTGQVDRVTVAPPRTEPGDHYAGADPELGHRPAG